ncbi:hypothetical protein BCAR13_360075 [Paraburkholderia caribensis]|nr:hypothetical protein BCAR13_360075 [Paraburkholderia caribensis]
MWLGKRVSQLEVFFVCDALGGLAVFCAGVCGLLLFLLLLSLSLLLLVSLASAIR